MVSRHASQARLALKARGQIRIVNISQKAIATFHRTKALRFVNW